MRSLPLLVGILLAAGAPIRAGSETTVDGVPGPAGAAVAPGAGVAAVGARPGSVAADSADFAPGPIVVPVEAGADWNAFCLRRAVGLRERGDGAAAVRALLSRDESNPADPRADFLLAWGLRELGDRDGARRAMRDLRISGEGDEWAAVARTLARLEETATPTPEGAGDDAPGANATDRILALELMIRSGRAAAALALLEDGLDIPDAVADALAVRARESVSTDPGEDLRRLSRRSPHSEIEEELVVAARLRLAAERLAGGADPDELLDVDGEGPSAFAARHARVLAALERGDTESARTGLAALLRDAPAYERRRDVAVALGFLALRDERWDDARSALASAEASWQTDDAALTTLLASEHALDETWRAWSATGHGAMLALDVSPVEASFRRIARETRDMHRRPDRSIAAARFSSPPRAELPPALTPPTGEERIGVAVMLEDLARLRVELGTARRELAGAQRRAELLADYLDEGLDRSVAEKAALDDALARIDAIVARKDEIVAKLDAVRDEEQRRILVRTARFLQDARDNLTLARSLVRFRLEGPAASRAETLPAGIPSPAEILAAEQLLASELTSWFETFAEIAPDLIGRSHQEIWIPRATTGAFDLQIAATRQAAWIDELVLAILDGRTAAVDPALLAVERNAVESWSSRVAATEAEIRGRQREIVREHVGLARAQLAAEHEGLAYGVAVAMHELAVETARDIDDASRRADARRLLAETDRRYGEFLEAHPSSPARSEVRFRLADARMHVARADFHDAMTRFLGEGGDPSGGGGALAPFVDYEPALEIYLALLEDDPAFVHRDAVLYHLGMILSDGGDPRAIGYLGELVERHPDSPHAQEAQLRLGDDRFAAQEFAACLAHYESAASGTDPEHAAIALYRVGWAHFNLDRFDRSALAFRRLLDLYGEHESAARTTDLRDEGERHLVEALARGDGAPAFAQLFDEHGSRPYEPRVLDALGTMMRRFSLFEEATATDSLWLARWPESPGALDAAQRMVQTIERANDADAARETWLAVAPRFRTGSAWWRANESDSLHAEADDFARGAYRAAALHHHRVARDTDQGAEWQHALALYEELIEGWPDHGGTPTHHFYAGEAAAALDEYERALGHFGTAAESDTASFRADAAWQGVTVRDAWYEAAREARVAVAGDSATGPDSLATPLIESIDDFLGGWPADPRSADLVWRKANLAWAHGWRSVAADGFAELQTGFPEDARVLSAARLHGRALYELEDFVGAAGAYDDALRLARTADEDSLAAEIAPLVPHCRFREAERVATAAGGDGGDSAPLFEEVAERWPDWEHAETSLYRAGLGFAAAGQPADAVRAWSALTERWPAGEYARDASLNVARTWEQEGRSGAAARAYERFSEAFAEDEDAAVALLQAADLYDAAADPGEAERLRTRYLDRYPEDVETALAILGQRAEKDLASVGPDRPISALLRRVSGGAAAPGAAGAGAAGAATSLARYLELAGQHGELADRGLLAEVQFRESEEVREDYERVRISLPLDKSIAQKQSLLQKVLQEYQSCAELGVSPWNRAAATRIGECLVGFGEALMDSERPSDLTGDDLLAYEEVLEEQSWEFFDRGEEAWAELIRQVSTNDTSDEWVARAKSLLWPRVALRFVHRPEVEYPLIVAAAPPDGGHEQP